MISFLKGQVAEAGEGSIVMETGGVGFLIQVPASVLQSVSRGDKAKIYTYMNVTEQDISLYGFLTREDLDMFKKLLTVSGVGPRNALNVISTLGTGTLKMAIFSGDAKSISQTPGVGAKTAQRIILDLKDKVEPDLAGTGMNDISSMETSNINDAILGLEGMGFIRTEIMTAIRKCDVSADTDTEEIIKRVLKVII